MKRTSLKSLILLNWKGLFYHRFDLHERVTALEGQNGAGKTTVMIAAYVALLPDLTKLRFTNVGEHGATGGDRGIYGRMGETGRPTYTVLDICLPDETRLLCGVQLVRKSAPGLELTPFIITGIAWQTSAQDLLLARSDVDAIPELDELKQNAARFGGRLISFSSAKDYFAALFDHGVTPMRLVSEDEREKFNEVLRTSMVGGISRALGSELRSFLLKEESGLADALKQMRSNLDACRKTRSEVNEAEQIELQIRGVMEAGQEMFAAAIHAVRSRAAELRKLWDDARARYDRAYEQLNEIQKEAAGVDEAYARAEQKWQETKEEQQAARSAVELLSQRCELDRKIASQQETQARQEAATAKADEQQMLAAQHLERSRNRERSARDAEARAAQGLADLTRGMAELAQRAAAHELACQALERLKSAHSIESSSASELDRLPVLEREHQQELAALDGQIIESDRHIQTAAQHAASFARVSAALAKISAELELEEESSPSARYQNAQKALVLLQKFESLAEEIPTIEQDLQAAQSAAAAQQKTRSEAAELLPSVPHIRSADVFAARDQAEQDQEQAAARVREMEAELKQLKDDAAKARLRIQDLEKETQAYRNIQSLADELAADWQQTIVSSTDAESLHGLLEERRRVVHRDIVVVQDAQAKLQQELWSTEQSGRLPEPVRRAASQIDGELLVERFEDVPLEEAGRVQARLGPLYEAILVEDIASAVSRLSALDEKNRPETVWLVEECTDLQSILESEGSTDRKKDVWVPGPGAHRLTRIPDRPVLGSRARMRRVGELRIEEQKLGEQLAALRSDAARLDVGVDGLLRLLKQSGVLDRGDPTADLLNAQRAEEEAEAAQPPLRERLKQQIDAVKLGSDRKRRLVSLCERAYLLDPPDQGALASKLDAELKQARLAHQRLRKVAEARRLLEAELNELRMEPLSDEQRAELVTRKAQLEETRDGKARLLNDIQHLIVNGVALGWGDAVTGLAKHKGVTQAMEEQLRRAQQERELAGVELDKADKQHRGELEAALRARAALDQAGERLKELNEEREKLGGTDLEPAATATALREQKSRLQQTEILLAAQEKRRTELSAERAKFEERRDIHEKQLKELQDEVGKAERSARPEQERWERIERRAQETGVLAAALAERFVTKFADKGAVNLWSIANEQRARLCERLQSIREGSELKRQIEQMFSSDSEQSRGETTLDAWRLVRGFLLRCIPAQIAEASDPEVALGRLRMHLQQLEHRLTQQEEKLRGNSQDVAHNIEGMVRKARKQVTRLNQDLGMVRFGSIVGVRIKVVPVEKMDRVLQALKEGAVQALLFQSDMPLEEALEEIFKTYGGGRSGGHKLLDYREYLELVVEIRRQVSTDWEPVNATKMSTGEAIGVGAAVMMVVLTAWERDANLLRAKRTTGTLRLLFLDEANRLSRDSLDVLFDLCEGLDLQLLIAAPEVANAEGNITHHLVRAVDQGREEVRVSARRVVPRAKEDEVAVHVA